MKKTVSFSVAILAIGFASVLAAQEAKLVGHWEGAIVLAAAEQEVDIVTDFNRVGGQVKGQLWFPVTGDGAHEVHDFTVQGSRVSFSVRDKDGVISVFDGGLSPDGASLRGTMKESGQLVPFTLRRAKADWKVREIPLYKLSPGGLQLKMAFNEDVGKTRLLLLLNMGSFTSKMALRVVQRFVMDSINDPKLRVYVVWMAPDTPQAAKVLQQGAALAPDPRITQFWSNDPSLLKVFEPMLASNKKVLDPCLLFAPDKIWTTAAPLPDRIRQSAGIGGKNPVKPGQKLNGVELATDVQILLATKKGR